jgi:hypothetical protein
MAEEGSPKMTAVYAFAIVVIGAYLLARGFLNEIARCDLEE